MNLRSWRVAGDALALLLPILIFALLLAIVIALFYSGVTYTDPATNANVKISFQRRTWLFMMGATFGTILGCFMGASQNLPAANILNVVVPLVSGYIAYITSKDLAVEIRLFVPGAVASLLIALLVSFWHMRLYYAPTA